MKKIFTPFLLLLATGVQAQTITYGNFSAALNDTLPANIANNASFNPSLLSTTGNGVTWNASGLTAMASTPTVHLSFHAPATTPYASLYPAAAHVEFDPALTAAIPYNYLSFLPDSLVEWGNYDPDQEHEIYQNPDKRLIFPFAFGQSFTDTYAKTNYSDATTISSYQTGSRTVTFSGYGTLVLPQGSFSNVGMVTEVRTNSLGPDAYYYTWYDLSNGKRLLFHSENDGSITTVWCADAVTGIKEKEEQGKVVLFPNPVLSSFVLRIDRTVPLNNTVLKIYNAWGDEIRSVTIANHDARIGREGLPSGTFFYQLHNNGQVVSTGKLVLQ